MFDLDIATTVGIGATDGAAIPVAVRRAKIALVVTRGAALTADTDGCGGLAGGERTPKTTTCCILLAFLNGVAIAVSVAFCRAFVVTDAGGHACGGRLADPPVACAILDGVDVTAAILIRATFCATRTAAKGRTKATSVTAWIGTDARRTHRIRRCAVGSLLPLATSVGCIGGACLNVVVITTLFAFRLAGVALRSTIHHARCDRCTSLVGTALFDDLPTATARATVTTFVDIIAAAFLASHLVFFAIVRCASVLAARKIRGLAGFVATAGLKRSPDQAALPIGLTLLDIQLTIAALAALAGAGAYTNRFTIGALDAGGFVAILVA